LLKILDEKEIPPRLKGKVAFPGEEDEEEEKESQQGDDRALVVYRVGKMT